MSTSTQVVVLLPTERRKLSHFTVVLMNPCSPLAKLRRNVCSSSLFLALVLLVGSFLPILHPFSPCPAAPTLCHAGASLAKAAWLYLGFPFWLSRQGLAQGAEMKGSLEFAPQTWTF